MKRCALAMHCTPYARSSISSYSWPIKYGARIHYSLRFDKKSLDEYKPLPCPSIDGCRFRAAGSYNGLVCLVEDIDRDGYNCILWNPVINKVIRLPQPSSRFSIAIITVFGFDSKTNDYKVLRFAQADPCIEVEVYSLNANCWTSISTPIAPKYGLFPSYICRYGKCFVNGAIHLLAYDRNGPRSRNLVLAFDVSEQVFTEIPLPECLSYDDLIDAEVLKYGQSSIATVTRKWGHFSLWAMEEYAVATTWTEVWWVMAAEGTVSRVLFVRRDEQVFVPLEGGRIASFDIKTKYLDHIFGVESIGSLEDCLAVDSYVESLVLLDKCCNGRWDVIPIDQDYANSTHEFTFNFFNLKYWG
ncbi:hypothetical protein COLO4_14558 [Corchorus olitorius]|uniref:F-box associated beta-propeller type 1 domain-containing protein n=1 Tax=Corchorus olitorius TaxID=93759 RepID=A0A1R3JRM2_9ROSI|nr:hypothetical protein COLO4_14558 [Corchorus olitorius]